VEGIGDLTIRFANADFLDISRRAVYSSHNTLVIVSSIPSEQKPASIP
jgi:hypothetical protein